MESHCLSDEEEKIEHSEMIDNRAQLHGLMRNAMERVSVYLLRKVKGVQHFSPLMMIDRHLRCEKTDDACVLMIDEEVRQARCKRCLAG